MKSTHIFVLALAVALYGAPAMAQHGHPGGMGGGMGSGMGNSASMGHGSATGHNGSASTNPGSAQGTAMNQVLTNNTQLANKIQTLTGMSAQDACGGFKNLGQCIAAAHVSRNLGVNFACLKADMTGTTATGTSCGTSTNTSSKGMSLGQAIQNLSPTVNSKSEAKKANKQAQQDLNGTNS